MIDTATSAELIRVGIAEGAVCAAPQRLRTTGLGSCVGIILFDPVALVAGLVHIMLPSAPPDVNIPAKYADSGLRWLLKATLEAGAARARLRAKIAGGAQMFLSAGKSDLMRVGPRNVDAVMRALSEEAVSLVAQDVGGSTGRTIEFDVVTGLLQIRTATRGTYDI